MSNGNIITECDITLTRIRGSMRDVIGIIGHVISSPGIDEPIGKIGYDVTLSMKSFSNVRLVVLTLVAY